MCVFVCAARQSLCEESRQNRIVQRKISVRKQEFLEEFGEASRFWSSEESTKRCSRANWKKDFLSSSPAESLSARTFFRSRNCALLKRLALSSPLSSVPACLTRRTARQLPSERHRRRSTFEPRNYPSCRVTAEKNFRWEAVTAPKSG